MSELIINKPDIPREVIEGKAEITKITVAYDHALVTARRENDDLVFTFDDGHETVLKDFFVHHSPQSLADFLGGIDKIAGLDVAMDWNREAEPPLEGEPTDGEKEGADTGAADGKKTTVGPDGQDVLHDGLAGNAAEKPAESAQAGEPAGEQAGNGQPNGQDSTPAPVAEGTSPSPASPPAALTAQGGYKEWLDIAWTAENGVLPELGSTVKGQLPEIWTGIDKVGGLDVSIPVKSEEIEHIPGGVGDDYVKPNGIPTLSLTVEGGVAIEAGVGRDSNHVLASDPMQIYDGSVAGTSGGSISGQLSASDPDGDALTFGVSTQGGGVSYASGGAVAVQGQHGLLTLQADGSYAYTLLTDHTGISDRLAVGEKAQDTFTLHVSDGKGGTASVPFSVTVTGTNDAPVISFVPENNKGQSEENALKVVENSGDKGTAAGRVQGTDADSDNGAGTSTAAGAENTTGLRFSLSAAEQVTSVHLDAKGNIVTPDGNNYVGIFSVDAETGEYSFTVNNNNATVAALGISGSIALTPPVYVRDVHSATAETAVHVLIEGKDAGISVTTLPSSFILNLKESGVHGDDAAISGNANVPVTGTMTAGGAFVGKVAEGDTLTYTLTWGDKSISVPAGDGPQTLETTYGSITLKGDGSYTYTLDDKADKLTQGQKVEEKFTITLNSAKHPSATVERDFTVNIEGTNDAPVLTLNTNTLNFFESGVGASLADGVLTPVEGGTAAAENNAFTGTLGQSLSGSFTGADKDTDSVLTYGGCTGTTAPEPDSSASSAFTAAGGGFATGQNASVTLAGEHGTLEIFANGTYTYTPKTDSESVFNRVNENETITLDSFTVYVKDEHGSWDSKPVTITLTGANDAPELAFATAAEAGSSAEHALTVQEDGTQKAQGTTVATDADAENGGGAATTANNAHDLHFGFMLDAAGAASGSNLVSSVWVKWVAGEGDKAGHTEFVAASGSLPDDVLGTLAVDGCGKYTFTLNNGSSQVQGLHSTEGFNLSVPVTVVDNRGASDTKDVHIRIDGQDDAAKLINDAAATFTVKEEGVYSTTTGGVINGNNATTAETNPSKLTDELHLSTVTGSFHAEDPDAGDLESMVFSVTADGGTAAVNTALNSVTTVNTTYGQMVITCTGVGKFSYTYTLTDRADVLGQGSTKAEVITLKNWPAGTETFTGTALGDVPINITVQGTNDVPVITSITSTGSGELSAVHATVTGTVKAEDKDTYVYATSGRDADQESLRYFLQDSDHPNATPNIMTGEFGYITLDQSTGQYTYTLTEADKLNKLSGSQTFSETFHVQAVDPLGAKSEAKPLTITIKGTDDPLVMGNVTSALLEDDETIQAGAAHTCTGTFTATDADTGIANLSGITGAADTITLQNVTLSTSGAGNVPADVSVPSNSVKIPTTGASGETPLTLNGLYGTLTITGIDNNATDGNAGFSYTYTLHDWLAEGYTGERTDEQKSLFDMLQSKNTDSSLTETFTVSGVSSGNGTAQTGTISIKITGTDDAPIMSSHEYYDENLAKQTISSDAATLNTGIETHVQRGQNYTEASVDGKIGSTDVDDTVLAYGFRVVHYDTHELTQSEIDAGMYTVNGLTLSVPAGAAMGETLAGGYVLVQQQTNGTYMYTAAGGTSTIVPSGLAIEMIQDYEGQYGTLHVNADGSYTYTVDPTRAHGILEGNTKTESFTITVKDSHLMQNGASGEDSTTLNVVVHGNKNSGETGTLSLVELVNSAVGVVEDGTTAGANKTATGDIAPANNDANPYATFFLLKGASVTKANGETIENNSPINTADINGIDANGPDGKWTVDGLDGNGISKTNTIVDEYGTLTLNPLNGTYTYTLHDTGVVQTLAEGETRVLYYAVGSGNQLKKDENGNAVNPTLDDLTSIITITIKGTNDAPTFTQKLDDLTVTADDAAATGSIISKTGQTYADDVDSDDYTTTDDKTGNLIYSFTGDGNNFTSGIVTTRYVIYNTENNKLEFSTDSTAPTTYFGTLTLNTSTGKYEFILNHTTAQVQAMRGDESISISVPVIVTDSHGASSEEKSFTITINGSNAAPVITGGLANAVTEDAASTVLTGTITATDADTGLTGSGDTLTYQAALLKLGGWPTLSPAHTAH